MQILLNSKLGAFIIGSSWVFFLTALGYGLFVGKIPYDFFGPIITAVMGGGAVHYVYNRRNGNGNGSSSLNGGAHDA